VRIEHAPSVDKIVVAPTIVTSPQHYKSVEHGLAKFIFLKFIVFVMNGKQVNTIVARTRSVNMNNSLNHFKICFSRCNGHTFFTELFESNS
jgi:hypothetical protein